MEILKKLQEEIGDGVQKNIPLAPCTTYKLGGPARYFFSAKTAAEVKTAAEAAAKLNLPIFILGGGSNILVSDSGFNGLAIKMENKQLEISGKIIKAGAGMFLGSAVLRAWQNNLSGLEWAIGVPGTIGGAVRGNAGAFGKSTSDNVASVQALKTSGAQAEIITLTKERCDFDYRESIFKKNNDLIILSAELKLNSGAGAEIRKQMLEFINKRCSSHPKFPSAGCSFKNITVTDEIREKMERMGLGPAFAKASAGKGGKIGAGWFIDQAGLKGYKIGGAQVSDEHANFIVKIDGTARAEHVAILISYVKQQVRDKFGVQLQEEVQYVGF